MGLSNTEVLSRPSDFILSYLGVKGIASLNGEPWQVNRRYCFHVLRNLGFAKKSMEAHIQEEIQCFVNLLSFAEGQAMLVAQKLAASVANNISALVFGQRSEVKTRENNMENYFERDFIDGYLRKIEENKGTDSHFNQRHLEGNVINLYGAATNTVRTAILWNLYIAASDPDGMQAKVQREIDAVIGREKAIEWEDRRRLPYTMASVLETLRWRTTAPIGVHRIFLSRSGVDNSKLQRIHLIPVSAEMNVGSLQNLISYLFEWGSFWTVFTTWLAIILATGECPYLDTFHSYKPPYHITFKELSKQYGPIIKLRLGCKDVLVLNDLTSIKEGLSNPDVLYRPSDFIFRHLGIEGIASINGEQWQVNRRYCFHVLRDLGFARKSMEKHIQEEVQSFMAMLASGKKAPMMVAHTLASSVANNITALVFGERYDLGDPKGRYVERMLSKLLREAHFFSLTDFLPALRYLRRFIRNEVSEREGAMEEHLDKDFIDGYLRKIEENKGKDSHFTLSALVGSTVNFYSAATNTVRSAVLWNLYIAASDPDGQQTRIQSEIDAAIGRKKPPAWEDRRRTPFTMACILEALRWRTTAPLGLQRAEETVPG
ncbi:hypothetical protein MTO96_002075 [Rhipicephalus appendiculatus]